MFRAVLDTNGDGIWRNDGEGEESNTKWSWYQESLLLLFFVIRPHLDHANNQKPKKKWLETCWQKKMRAGIAQKSRISHRVNGGVVGAQWTVDSGANWRKSSNQIQTLKECLLCHIYCAHLDTLTSSFSFSSRESQFVKAGTKNVPDMFFVPVPKRVGIKDQFFWIVTKTFQVRFSYLLYNNLCKGLQTFPQKI